jgi:shikimate dehydrogenase
MKTPFEKAGTRVYGIIGDPVGHSVSPAMHTAAFKRLGLDCQYVPFRVEREKLRAAVEGLKALNVSGFNVTIPHKVAIMRYLDELDTLAENLGAVNCVVNQGGYLKGYNTDAGGFLRALVAAGFNPTKKSVAILGSGGAGRAIAFILADKGADLVIFNRHVEAAYEIAEGLSGKFRREIRALKLSPTNLKAGLDRVDLLINATSLGMVPAAGVSPVPAGLMRKDLAVFDLVYNPLRTRLLEDASRKGAKAIGGLEMLVHQGAVAFELWTGQKAPLATMRRAALAALKKYEE